MASQAEEGPAEAIAVGDVVGVPLHGLADHPVGPFQVHVPVGPEVAQVVQRADVVGELVEHLLEPALRLGEVAGEHGEVGKDQPRFAQHLADLGRAELGVELLDQLGVDAGGLLVSLVAVEDPGHAALEPRRLRIQLGGLARRGQGLLGAAVQLQRAGEVKVQNGAVVGKDLLVDPPLEHAGRRLVLVPGQETQAPGKQNLRRPVRIRPGRPLEELAGRLHLSGLQRQEGHGQGGAEGELRGGVAAAFAGDFDQRADQVGVVGDRAAL